jgi:hypothetical protein
MAWLLYLHEMAPVPTEQEVGWNPESVWMISGEQEICCPSQDWNPGQSSLWTVVILICYHGSYEKLQGTTKNTLE